MEQLDKSDLMIINILTTSVVSGALGVTRERDQPEGAVLVCTTYVGNWPGHGV